MTVRENVQIALLAHHRQRLALRPPRRGLFRAEADALLAQVGLADQADRAAGVLAYGDLKRLELAIALADAPALLLMDEPTAGMAPGRTRRADATGARPGARASGIAVLFTEHDMDVVFGIADRILVLDRGRADRRGRRRRDPRRPARPRGLPRRRRHAAAATDADVDRPARLLRPRPHPARRLASRCSAGEVMVLLGRNGAGKTHDAEGADRHWCARRWTHRLRRPGHRRLGATIASPAPASATCRRIGASSPT